MRGRPPIGEVAMTPAERQRRHRLLKKIGKKFKMVVIAYGDIFSGIILVGEFYSSEEASAYAEKYLNDKDWHVVPLHRPDPGFKYPED